MIGGGSALLGRSARWSKRKRSCAPAVRSGDRHAQAVVDQKDATLPAVRVDGTARAYRLAGNTEEARKTRCWSWRARRLAVRDGSESGARELKG